MLNESFGLFQKTPDYASMLNVNSSLRPNNGYFAKPEMRDRGELIATTCNLLYEYLIREGTIKSAAPPRAASPPVAPLSPNSNTAWLGFAPASPPQNQFAPASPPQNQFAPASPPHSFQPHSFQSQNTGPAPTPTVMAGTGLGKNEKHKKKFRVSLSSKKQRTLSNPPVVAPGFHSIVMDDAAQRRSVPADIVELLEQPENWCCADCGADLQKIEGTWASVNLGKSKTRKLPFRDNAGRYFHLHSLLWHSSWSRR